MKITTIAAVILLAVSSNALAQDLVYSDDHTVSCMGANEPNIAFQACVGVSANACMEDTQGGFSTGGMGGCLDRELAYWDARLNRSYKALMKREKATDVDMAEVDSNIPSLVKSLRAMQLAWIPFRDATCDYERAQWGDGTGGGPATLSCLMMMTAKQVQYLESAGFSN